MCYILIYGSLLVVLYRESLIIIVWFIYPVPASPKHLYNITFVQRRPNIVQMLYKCFVSSPLVYERMFLPLCKVADTLYLPLYKVAETSFHTQGD